MYKRQARKVQQCILLVGEISDIYVDGYRRMVGDENFTPAELAAIAAGYARIIEASAGELKELQDIVNPTDTVSYTHLAFSTRRPTTARRSRPSESRCPTACRAYPSIWTSRTFR